MNFTNEYLTAEDIAKVILVDSSTVRRWMREGRLKHSRFGKAVRVKTKDFEAFCQENEID